MTKIHHGTLGRELLWYFGSGPWIWVSDGNLVPEVPSTLGRRFPQSHAEIASSSSFRNDVDLGSTFLGKPAEIEQSSSMAFNVSTTDLEL